MLNLKQHLNTNYIGQEIRYLESVSSTNDYLKKIAKDIDSEGLIVIANEQTKGKGRLGRTWITTKDDSIAISILLKPNVNIERASLITMIAGVSVVEGIQNSTDITPSIKWPNDIYIDNKKLGGILAESSFNNGTLEHIVLGIGININQTNFDKRLESSATSLKKVCGKELDKEVIIANILNVFEKYYNLFKSNDLMAFMDKLKHNSCVLGKNVAIINNNETYIGKAINITDSGSILIKLNNGEIREFVNGDISLRRI